MTWLTHLKIRFYLLVKLETFVENQIYFYIILQQHLFHLGLNYAISKAVTVSAAEPYVSELQF